MSKSLVQNSRVIAKVIRKNDGTLALGFFAVYQENNGYSVRLVGVRAIGTASENQVFLPTVRAPKSFVLPVQSPYFSDAEIISQNFSFLTSQPTRAPNLN